MGKFKIGDKVWCAGGCSDASGVWEVIVLPHSPNCPDGFYTLQTIKPLETETFFFPESYIFYERSDAIEVEFKRIKNLIKHDEKEIKRLRKEIDEISKHRDGLLQDLHKLLEPPGD
jgi:hypothetical protein